DGANSVTATDLKVEKNFSITNGTNTSGSDQTSLANLTVGGSLTINNGSGDTSIHLNGNSAGTSAVQGSITITNGSGEDDLQITDMNVGGNLSVNDGHGNASGIAGYTEIFNTSNTSFRSTIKGNVTVSYLDGNTTFFNDGIWDTEVQGNVTFNHGSGSA